MNYFKSTMKYIALNLPMLLLFSVIPAIVLTFTSNLWKFVAFFANSNAVSLSFNNIYHYFSFMLGESTFLGLLGIFVIAFFASLMYASIERHMKIGKISISRPFSRVDETILAVLPVFVFFVLALEIFALFNTVLIVCGALISKTVAIVVSYISTIALVSVLIALVVQIIFWVPSMIVLGYPLKSALLFSMNAVSGKTGYIFKHFAIMFAVSALVSGCSYVFLAGYIGQFTMILNFIIYTFLFMFVIAYTMVAFFDIAEETRNDLKNKKNYIT